MTQAQITITADKLSHSQVSAEQWRQLQRVILAILPAQNLSVVTLKPLTLGISHASFRIQLQGEDELCHDWVVRLISEQGETPWLAQGVELKLLVQLSHWQITAPVVACDPKGHWLVTEFVEGIHPKDHLSKHSSSAWLDDLARCFKRLDSIVLPDELAGQLPTLDLHLRCQQLFNQINAFPACISPVTVSKILHYISKLDLSTVNAASLCHGDLHQGNLLLTSTGVKLLDWEYASMGSRLIDVAAISQDLALTQQQIDYLMHQAGYLDWVGYLPHFALAYRLMELLWYMQSSNIDLISASQLESKWQQLLACWLQSQNA